jgi:hypothetical protein
VISRKLEMALSCGGSELQGLVTLSELAMEMTYGSELRRIDILERTVQPELNTNEQDRNYSSSSTTFVMRPLKDATWTKRRCGGHA